MEFKMECLMCLEILWISLIHLIDNVYRIEFLVMTLMRFRRLNLLQENLFAKWMRSPIFPAKHDVTTEEKFKSCGWNKKDLDLRYNELKTRS